MEHSLNLCFVLVSLMFDSVILFSVIAHLKQLRGLGQMYNSLQELCHLEGNFQMNMLPVVVC